jgi:hypothetical protein
LSHRVRHDLEQVRLKVMMTPGMLTPNECSTVL